MFRILSLDGGGIKGAFTASVLSCFLDQPLDKIDVLSIGTPFAPFSIAKNRNAGIIKWNVGMIDLMFEAQAQTATAQANLLLKKSVLRIDVSTLPGQFSLDDATADKIGELIDLGWGEAVKKANLDVMKARFLSEKAQPFVSLHAVT